MRYESKMIKLTNQGELALIRVRYCSIIQGGVTPVPVTPLDRATPSGGSPRPDPFPAAHRDPVPAAPRDPIPARARVTPPRSAKMSGKDPAVPSTSSEATHDSEEDERRRRVNRGYTQDMFTDGQG